MKQSNRLILISALAALLLITPVFFAAAASPRVYISAVSPGKSGYAVDESVTINGKIKWEDLTANKTISIQLWNSTDSLETLESYTIPYNVSGTLTEDGSYSGSWTPSTKLTEEVGSTTYYLKIFGSDGLEIDSEPVVILVAEPQLSLSVVWQDQNNDRVVEKNEAVVFTVYTSWSFVEDTESHSLYVDWGNGAEELLDTISITAGSGDDTTTTTKGFDTEGTKTVTFKLKDSTGTVVKTQTASIKVGSQASETSTTTAPAAGSSSVVSLVTANWQILVIVGAAVVVGAVLLKKPESQPRSRKAKR